MDLESLGPPASMRRIDGCAALRARREASVAPAGPASCCSASPCAHLRAILKPTAYDDDIVGLWEGRIHFEKNLAQGGKAERGQRLLLNTFLNGSAPRRIIPKLQPPVEGCKITTQV